MSGPIKNKTQLLEAIRTARAGLEKKFTKLTPEQMIWPGSMEVWSVKDILAHLVDWERRFAGWYVTGLRGNVPETPAPGMIWRELPKLNKQGYVKHKDDALDEVLEAYERSYTDILTLVEGMTEEEIFTPGYYKWTGSSALLGWITANTSSHYNWAKRNVRTTVIRKAFEEG
jgi:hypothetical protein